MALALPEPYPEGHVVHVCDAESSAYAFSGQGVQLRCPDALLALPGMHGRHNADLFSDW